MVKRAVITGHTQGIGHAIATHLSNSGWEITGFSRSTGHDLRDPVHLEQIVEACKSAALFVNNAHVQFVQTQLLFKVFDIWRELKDRTILNIGVDTVPASNWQVVYRAYPVEKVAMHAAVTELQNHPRKCRLINLCLGHVNTPSNTEDVLKIELPDLIKTVDWILKTPEGLEVKNLTLAAL